MIKDALFQVSCISKLTNLFGTPVGILITHFIPLKILLDFRNNLLQGYNSNFAKPNNVSA
jgi:hypothetical protein